VIPCENMDRLPPVLIELNGHAYPIPPSQYLFPVGDHCVLGFATPTFSSSKMPAQWILGDLFLRSVYTVFDMGDCPNDSCAQLGFAQAL